MYAGKFMEYAEVDRVFGNPFHPYTLGLKNAFQASPVRKTGRLSRFQDPPSLFDPPDQCRFYSRCPFSTSLCAEKEPVMREVADNHYAACHHVDRVEEMREKAVREEIWDPSLNP